MSRKNYAILAFVLVIELIIGSYTFFNGKNALGASGDPDYVASADGSLLTLDAKLLGLTLAKVGLGKVDASANSSLSSNNAKATASNVDVNLLGLGVTLDKNQATAPPDSDPPSRTLLSVPLAPLADIGVIKGDSEAHYNAGSSCPTFVNGVGLISKSHVQMAGLSLVNVPTTNINIADIGIASKDADTKIAGNTLSSSAGATVGDITLLGGRIRLAVSDTVKLDSKSTSTSADTTMNNVLVSVFVDNVLQVKLTVGNGGSIPIVLNIGPLLQANVTVGVGTFTKTSAGTSTAGSLDSILSVNVGVTNTLLGTPLLSTKIVVGGMSTSSNLVNPGQIGADCQIPLKCSQLSEWTAFVKASGLTGDELYPTIKDALAGCFMHCPKATSNTGNLTDYIIAGRSEIIIPVSGSPDTSTSLGRGQYCFDYSTKQHQTIVRNVIVDNSKFYPMFWSTEISDGLSPGVKPGKPFVTQNKSALTKYGQLISDCMSSGNPVACWPTQAQVNSAVAADVNSPKVALDLTPENKTAIGQGGVANVINRETNYPKITISGTPQTCDRERKVNYNFYVDTNSWSTDGGQTPGAWSNNCPTSGGELTGPIIDGGLQTLNGWAGGPQVMSFVLSILNSTTTDNGFWQIFGTHCNSNAMGYLDDLNQTKLESRTKTSDNTEDYSVMSVTKDLSSVSNALFGAIPNNETNKTGYYDRQCGYDGKLSGTKVDNVYNIYFRDGIFHSGDVNLYRPENSSEKIDNKNGNPIPLVQDDNDDALRTIVTRWELGTPEPLGSGYLKLGTSDGQSISWTGPQAFPHLKNYTPTPLESSDKWAILEGQHSSLLWSAIWASEKAKPQVYLVRWEFDPLVAQRLPTENIGFAGPNGSQSMTKDVVQVKVQGSVFSRNDGADTQADQAMERRTTGSPYPSYAPDTDSRPDASIGGISGGLDSDGEWIQNPTTYSPFYYGIEFRRSTTS